jgi:Asp-tRNA(Asn)/Glu-tRNA(Gln) amidotransferase A subunit family amidase
MSAPEICFLMATELVRLVRAKKLSALEVMDAHPAQIERVNPEVNAIVTLTAEQAMDRARATDVAIARGEEVEALAGLPVAHKDLFPTEGGRTTFGSLVYKDVTVGGLPAASVPCGFTPEELPVGAQIVGGYRNDFGVLQLAHAFEEATHHGERRPPLAG